MSTYQATVDEPLFDAYAQYEAYLKQRRCSNEHLSWVPPFLAFNYARCSVIAQSLEFGSTSLPLGRHETHANFVRNGCYGLIALDSDTACTHLFSLSLSLFLT